MPRTTRPPRKPKTAPPVATQAEVMTLAETAAYLRLPEADIVRLVGEQGLPGRRMGNEWRFLKAAVQEWLTVASPIGNKEAQLAVVGSLKDDPTLDEFLRETYRRRGRPMTEEKE